MKTTPLELKFLGGFAAAMTALLLAGAQLYLSLQDYRSTTERVAHSYQVLDLLGEVMSDTREVESGQRAFIITGEELYVAERERLVARIDVLLERLKTLAADDEHPQQRVLRLNELVQARLAVLNKTVALYRKEGFASAQARVQTGVSRQSMDDLKSHVAALEGDERQLLRQRIRLVEHSAMRAQWVGALLLALACAGFGLLWRSARREASPRAQAQAQSLERELLLNQILELLPVGVFVTDAAGQITRINSAARAIWAGEHRVGMEQYGEYVGWWPHNGNRLKAEDWALARTLRSGETIRDELVDIRCFDGARKTISNSTMPIRNAQGLMTGGLAVNVDVTVFTRTERELRAAARYDETQSRALTLFATRLPPQEIFEQLLSLLARQHGFAASALYTFDEWSAHYGCAAAHGLGADAPRNFALGEGLLGQAALSAEVCEIDTRCMTLQTGVGDFLAAQVLLAPVAYQERRLAVLVLAAAQIASPGDRAFIARLAAQLGVAMYNQRQFEDLKALAQQLRGSSDEIAAKNRQLEEASRLKSEFLANMSHELRTPLNAIIGFSELLKDGLMGPLPGAQQTCVQDIFGSGMHLLSLINDILDLSKVEAGKMTLELGPVRVADLLQTAVQMIKQKSMAHHLKISTEFADGPAEAWLDERKAKQILYNLLSNAVKFTPEGGEVRLKARQIKGSAVSLNPALDYLEIAVSDNGIGIAPQDQAHLFQPFVQIDSGLARRFEGTGLGLVMVKRLTQLHGGAVGLVSARGEGSTFTVWLPWRLQADEAAPEPANAAAPPPTSTPPSPPAPGSPSPTKAPDPLGAPHVLVVEDDDRTAELLRIQLESAGFRVQRVATAEDALAYAATVRPDLVTLDIFLPQMDGWTFLERFRSQAQLASVPVVIISVAPDQGRGVALGAAQVLQKPVSRDALMQSLQLLGFGVSGATSPNTVLVVDDDPKAVQLISTYLDAGGFRALAAFGGQEGIEAARRWHPDLIVLDLMMPEVSGFEVVEALKHDPATATIPIIVVTAMQMTEAGRLRLQGDVLRVIEKSDFGHGGFIREVRRALTSLSRQRS